MVGNRDTRASPIHTLNPSHDSLRPLAALAINDSVLGLGRDSWRSSGFFRCLATERAATDGQNTLSDLSTARSY
jgi:hypothetical protein